MLARVRHQVRYRRALRSLVAPGAPDLAYFSRFGGLWTDRLDAEAEIDRRLAAGAIGDPDAERLRHWAAHGYLVLERAVAAEVCDRVQADLERAFAEGDSRLLMVSPAQKDPQSLGPRTDGEHTRVLDVHAYHPAARAALFSEPIVRFLRTIFDDAPVLFQSLTFQKGSEQPLHQDTGFVVTTSPLELAASWIALEDIRPGSGELTYLDGSHRLPEYLFSGRYKHWNAKRDGPGQHAEWHALMHTNAERMGLGQKTFLPKKGDVLIWSADLAHGGSPVTDPSLTRKSLVGHYCPNGVDPFYFKVQPDRTRKGSFGECFFASQYYPAEAWMAGERHT